MDPQFLQSYLAAIYELPSSVSRLRVSLDAEAAPDCTLPELLRSSFAIMTAYNPRSVPQPREVNEERHRVLGDLLRFGGLCAEPCVSFAPRDEGTWREPSWLVRAIARDEALAFGRAFRQNAILVCEDGRPEIVVTDATCGAPGTSYKGQWRLWR